MVFGENSQGPPCGTCPPLESKSQFGTGASPHLQLADARVDKVWQPSEQEDHVGGSENTLQKGSLIGFRICPSSGLNVMRNFAQQVHTWLGVTDWTQLVGSWLA